MLRIEQAQVRDFLAIAELDRAAWGKNRNSEFIPDGEHVWRIWCEHALVFVAKEEAGRIVGAVLAFPCMNGIFCVHKVMVAEECRGRGVGLKLFAQLFEELDKEAKACFLTVDPVNEAAIKLYQKMGFSTKERVRGYYRENEDRLVMVRAASA